MMFKKSTNKPGGRSRFRAAGGPPRFRPQVEALEGRFLLSAGAYDKAFANDGSFYGRYDINDAPNQDVVSGMALQPDGKIVLGINSTVPVGSQHISETAVLRLTADGAPDPTFGSQGWVRSPGLTNFSAVTLQPDGKILIAGWDVPAGQQFAHMGVVRLNPDGSSDATFGPSGDGVAEVSTTPAGATGAYAYAIALQPADGKIVLAGGGDYGLARLTADGTLDTSFGAGGFVTGITDAQGVSILANGEIVVGGLAATQNGHATFEVDRYLANGSLDSTFGTGGRTDFFDLGKQTVTAGSHAAMVVNGVTGKIVMAGTDWLDNFFCDFAVARLNADGTIDTNFGASGLAILTQSRLEDFATAVTLQRDGRILVAGLVGAGTSELGPGSLGVTRLDDQGNVDPSFTSDEAWDAGAAGIALQADGRIVVAGNIQVERLEGDPRPAESQPANLGQAAWVIAHSAEAYAVFVTGAYWRYLKCAPDPNSFATWISWMQQRLYTDEQVEAFFIGSAEYIADHGGNDANWIDGMYHDLLGRAPEPGAVQKWLDVLASRWPHAQVAYGFAASQEREQQRVTLDYVNLLGRAPEPGGLAAWVQYFIQGGANEDILAGFAGSSEFYSLAPVSTPAPGGRGRGDRTDWIYMAYQYLLHRPPSDGEVAAWLAFLQ
jgi:uncharacterized delta-60 repeat protein